ncbi:MAG: alpha/beta fold hydrolase [Dehalococcoidales bacterium]
MKRAYADIPEGQIHYRIEGDGLPILLLHMAVASSDEFLRAMHFLSRKYQAIAMDFLGAGDSDPAPYAYQIPDHARTVISFMDALGIKKANIVGHHLGSIVAAETQITWPKRVNKLVLSGLGYRPEPGEGIAFKDPPNFMSRVEIKADGSHLIEWWRRSALWGDYSPEILEERVLEYIKAGPRGEEEHSTATAYDLKHRLPLITCPTLVLTATFDPFFSGAEKVMRSIPDSKLAIIENGPIYLDRAMPQQFAEAILNFLNTDGHN